MFIRPISLIGSQYKIIGKILANRLSKVISKCISPVQSAFIKGRNILDGPFILNEVMAWYRKRKKKLMVFKFYFEKAFDSLRWDFLDLVMEKLAEFEISRGLRQGDPLSPFLFILAMEGLHALTCKTEELNLYKGASLGRDNMSITHLIYVDDVIFFGEWSHTNVHHLLCALRCFFLIPGFKINVHKSSILGVCVYDNEVSNMEYNIGCGAAKFPLKYLGDPTGCSMAKCNNWNSIIQKFTSKLSSWKARLLSTGGRLTLIKSVLGSLPTYYMSIYMMPVHVQKKHESLRNNFFISADQDEKKMTWVRWKKCLASKNLGGLGIGSIYGLNIGLLFKWIWRFLTRPTDLWACVIKSIHGLHGGIHDSDERSSNISTWSVILSSVRKLKQKGIDLLSFCTCKIGNGVSTRFWDDSWCENQPLKLAFPHIYMLYSDRDCSITTRLPILDSCSALRRPPRGGAESAQLNALRALIGDVVLSDDCDSWKRSLNASAGFSVASVRSLVDDNTLDVDMYATKWNRYIPIKVNVFLCRLMLNKIPSRVNLDRKGIDVCSVLCPICQDDVETVNHVFLSCDMAKDLWALMARWWNLDIPIFDNVVDWFEWLSSLHVSNMVRLVLEGVGETLLWSIWRFRNLLIFSNPPKKALLWDSIVSQSFLWISSKNPRFKCNRDGWLQNPVASIVSM
ncbi:RNA-directed DNA polymerase, eukaryota, reverse transcriptase zinc-binding domain protein [Tanacetum coccineum]